MRKLAILLPVTGPVFRPPPFMESLYDGLTGIGVRRERINLRVVRFRDGVNPESQTRRGRSDRAYRDGVVPVRFAKSAITVAWSRDRSMLLELAEAVGLAPVFGCRSGICGTCATQIISGAVEYFEPPGAQAGGRCGAARSPPVSRATTARAPA